MPYVILQIREGDIVDIRGLSLSRETAFHCMYNNMIGNDPTSWWKIVQFEHHNLDAGAIYEVAVDVHWESSLRTRVIGIYPVGDIPNVVRDNDRYFVDAIFCIR
jgi:hypothetical protein